MKVTFLSPTSIALKGSIFLGVFEENVLPPFTKEMDAKTQGQIQRSLAASSFKGKEGQTLEIKAPHGLEASRLILFGLGNPQKLDASKIEVIGSKIALACQKVPGEAAVINVEGIETKDVSSATVASRLAYGALLRNYRFDKYRTKEKAEDKLSLKNLTLYTSDPTTAQKEYDKLEKIAEGVFFTRDLTSEPPNVLYPESYAERLKEFTKLGVKVKIMDEEELKKLGMGALLGVGQGSSKKSCVVVLEWLGADSKDAPIALVGKGVTFDTGGISLKPSENMDQMKWDMGGSAIVAGTLKAIALRKAKVNVVGIVGLVENMPSGSAQRPGDIVKSLSGQTIEVLNTDAEGRLVLADVLWYAQEEYKPKVVIDLATLTGAIMIALGSEHAGLFSNDDDLSEKLTAAGKAMDEKVWRLPMGKAYDRLIDSPVADMKNIGGRAAGSITAAQFLKRFIKDGTIWAHLDVADMVWSPKDKPLAEKGATGYGVRLLNHLIETHYETA